MMSRRVSNYLRAGSFLAALLGMIAAAGAAEAARSLAEGPYSGIMKAQRRLVKTEAEWTKLWQEHQSNRVGADTKPPKVDWSKEMVLAVFLGSRPSGGYGVKVVEIAPEKGRLAVKLVERKPDPGMMSAAVITSPFHIVAVKKSSLPVAWKQ
jgi:hypothetical protein